MVVNNLTDSLIETGLSEYEAKAYIALLANNPATAYEIAKASGIPTSKIYEVLSRLSEKAIVSALNEKGTRLYIPMKPEEFIESRRSRIQATLDTLKSGLTDVWKTTDASFVWNIWDYDYLMDKAERIILQAKRTLLVSIWKEEMTRLSEPLRQAKNKNIKISIVHFGIPEIKVGMVFQHPIEDTIYAEKKGRGLVILPDSEEVLMGRILKFNTVEGIWSTNRGVVMLAEEYVKHDIYMMKVVRRFDRELKRMFGQRYEKLKDISSDEDTGHKSLPEKA
jgi:sugar-specific transcriptional regulator TrmB